MDIVEINNTIEELERGDTTFANCQKLSCLYIVREHLQNSTHEAVNTQVAKELNDILPQYKRYCEVKRRYQMHELTIEAVLQSMQIVCNEIDEFMRTLYSSTDTAEEREYIRVEIAKLQNLK